MGQGSKVFTDALEFLAETSFKGFKRITELSGVESQPDLTPK